MLCGHKKTAKCSRRLCPPLDTGDQTRLLDFAKSKITVAHCDFRVKLCHHFLLFPRRFWS